MGFSAFDLDEQIIKAIEESGYSEPTKIQMESIPQILNKKDVRASAQTGTGKTASFLLPALNLLAKSPSRGGKGAKILILTPTRELAQQITVQAEKYSKYMSKIRSVCIVGGVPYHKQQAKLFAPHDILIATPGRLIDYMNRGKINFSNLEMLVLDEADRMLDMGFSEPVEEIISQTPKSRQTLLFSATLKGEVLKLSQKFMKDPVEIVVHSAHEKHENIDQKLLYIDNLSHKNDLLDHILNAEDMKSAIVFTATKRHCDELVDELTEKGFLASAIHGDMNQRQRSRTIKMLQERKIDILVATDVAARGLDISDITHVINFDLPRDPEDYVHRIGRTGRAGKTGTALSFAGSKDMHMVPRIEKFTGQTISIIEIKGLEPKQKPVASTSDKSRSRGGGRSSGRPSRSSGDRNSRDSSRPQRSEGRSFSGGDSRPPRRDDRPFSGGDSRPPRRDDRPFSGGDSRAPRSEGRSFSGGDSRAPRRDDRPFSGGDSRPPRRDDRPFNGGDSRPPRRDDRPFNGGDSRPPRREGRSFSSGDSRAPRRDDRPTSEGRKTSKSRDDFRNDGASTRSFSDSKSAERRVSTGGKRSFGSKPSGEKRAYGNKPSGRPSFGSKPARGRR